VDDAESFVRDAINDGEWHGSAIVKEAGIKEGHRRRTLERAVVDLDVEVKEEGFPRRTYWRLPQSRHDGWRGSDANSVGAIDGGTANPDQQTVLDGAKFCSQSNDAMNSETARLDDGGAS